LAARTYAFVELPATVYARRDGNTVAHAAVMSLLFLTIYRSSRRTSGSLWEDHGLVFQNHIGKPMDHNILYKRDLQKRAGAGRIAAHLPVS
jgi:hypothetical protein